MTPIDFDALVRDHSRYVKNVVRKIVGAEDADDVAQQTWLKVWRHRASFRGESKPRTWLHRCATNEALSFLRNHTRRHRIAPIVSLDVHLAAFDADVVRPEFVDDAPRPDAVLFARERWDAVTRSIDRLSPTFQAAAIAALYESSTQEGAAVLGVKIQTYKSRLHRARKLLASADRAESVYLTPNRRRAPTASLIA